MLESHMSRRGFLLGRQEQEPSRTNQHLEKFSPLLHLLSMPLARRMLPAAITLIPKLARAELEQRIGSVVWISPDGGESSIDSWDPKPDAPDGIRSEFKTIDSAINGIRVTEMYPRMAKVLDRTVLLRARYVEGSLDHLAAMQAMIGREGRSHILSKHAEQRYGMPPFYAQTPGVISSFNYRGAAFGVPSIMFELSWDGDKRRFLTPNFGQPERMDTRIPLLEELDALQTPHDEHIKRLREKALAITGKLGQQIELRTEDLERYGGDHAISIGILTIRELIRSGLHGTYFLRAGDYDMHYHIFDNMAFTAPRMDAALSSLIEDNDSGMLDDTTIIYAGEFGRTPKINRDKGRDHAPTCSAILHGRTLQRGMVYGETDKVGYAKSGIVSARQFRDVVLRSVSSSKVTDDSAQTLPPIFR